MLERAASGLPLGMGISSRDTRNRTRIQAKSREIVPVKETLQTEKRYYRPN
jgi:hypothetical protein